MNSQQFEKLITEAVAALPKSIQAKLNNLDIVLEEGESPNNSLFGLYYGVSQLKRGSSYGLSPTLPDKITIYKGTIEKFAGDEQAIPSLIRRVVWHEVGHHFGFDEAEISQMEKKWEKDGRV
ncbi:MAG: metallopeptidase family protein [Candidatus Doudnabacteria bacterium]|nr:metallopeptidase family protein [Candidatus Doudnabacteria bacterium]